MKNIQAVVLDLDGTLLTSAKSISPRTHRALTKLRGRGCEIIVATARPPRAVVGLLPQEFYSNYIVYYNGALTVNEETDYREHRPLAASLVNDVLSAVDLAEGRCFITVECDDSWYCFAELREEDRTMFRLKPHQEPKLITRSEVTSQAVTKVLFRHDEHVHHIPPQFSCLSNTLITDGGTLVQITAHDATKEIAVANVLSIMGIEPVNVMVFGDDYNDLGLFKLCGFPVAMGNAVPELKQLSCVVTASNDDDGVAIVLEEMLKDVSLCF